MALVDVETSGNVLTVSLNRPEKRNALSQDMIKELSHILQASAQENVSHILILKGQGEVFCAGADIEWLRNIQTKSYDENYDEAQALADVLYQLYNYPRPTIVLAHGAVLGGGLGFLAACDIAIATDDTQFGFSEVRIGITPSCISPYIVAAMGERAARYYFLTGERFNAPDALRINLIHRVVTKENLTFKRKYVRLHYKLRP